MLVTIEVTRTIVEFTQIEIDLPDEERLIPTLEQAKRDAGELPEQGWSLTSCRYEAEFLD